MDIKFCKYLERVINKESYYEKRLSLMEDIEQYFKENGIGLNYRRLALVFMERSSYFCVLAMTLTRKIDRAYDVKELQEFVERQEFDTEDALEFIKATVLKYEDQPVSKMDAYYQDIRNGKRSPRFRSDVTTERIQELREKEKMTYEQISVETGLSRSTIINRLKKAKENNS